MRIRRLLLIAIAIFAITACNDDDDSINETLMHINVKMPEAIQGKNPRIVQANFELTNVNTGAKINKEVDYFPVGYFELEDGIYNVSVDATVKYETQNEQKTSTNSVEVRAIEQNVEVKGGNFDLPLRFFVYNPSSSFVISEIYYSGSAKTSGKGYRYDKFFEIYNNSDETLYADGLCIGESEFRSTDPYIDLDPETIRTDKIVLQVVYRIPGSGKQYLVKPGETLVLADVAKNHKEDNVNALDLSKANFEWYDDFHNIDVDIPEVPNLEKIVSFSKSIWSPFGAGTHSFVIFKLPVSVTAKQFNQDNVLTYTYINKYTGKLSTELDNWAIENKDVIDAVACSVPSKYVSLPFSPELDLNFTYVGESINDKYGHSVKRRIDHTTEDGRIVLMDTNDSSTDFISNAEKPSPGLVTDAK